MSSKLNKYQVARFLEAGIRSGRLDPATAAAAEALVAAIDAGEGGINAKAETLITDAYSRLARSVATTTGKAQRGGVAALVEVARLESQLGLVPEVETGADVVAETAAETATEVVLAQLPVEPGEVVETKVETTAVVNDVSIADSVAPTYTDWK